MLLAFSRRHIAIEVYKFWVIRGRKHLPCLVWGAWNILVKRETVKQRPLKNDFKKYCIHIVIWTNSDHIAGLAVNYGISNTIVLEIQ